MAPIAPPIARPAPPKGWLATLVVFLLMIGIVGAGFVAASSLSSVPNKPIEIANGVTVAVPPDWTYGGRSDDRRTILLSRGNSSVAITVADGTNESAALEQLRTEWTATGTVSAGDVVPVPDVRPDGKPAARFSYSGTFPGDIAGAVEGEVTGVRGSGNTVVFDGWAGVGQYGSARDDVASIIRETTIP